MGSPIENKQEKEKERNEYMIPAEKKSASCSLDFSSAVSSSSLNKFKPVNSWGGDVWRQS